MEGDFKWSQWLRFSFVKLFKLLNPMKNNQKRVLTVLNILHLQTVGEINSFRKLKTAELNPTGKKLLYFLPPNKTHVASGMYTVYNRTPYCKNTKE